jgi:succinyl-diaminopimelate desuccinylase
LNASESDVLNRIEPTEVVEFLQELIRQRSDFPPGDTRAAIKIVAGKLSKAGVGFEQVARREHQPSLLASLGEADHTSALMMHAHIDTVPVGDLARWTADPFGGEVRDGCIYGRGAGDDKGSVAAQVMAMVTLARSGLSGSRGVRLAVVADEESGALEGTRWLHDAGLLQPAALVVGEQTANRVAISERVACGIDLTIYGKSTHGAMPWAGDNAVMKAARVLNWLDGRLISSLAAHTHPYLPPATLNIGKVTGGVQWNIVPDRCKIEMDRRLLPGETREQAMAEIRVALDAYGAQVEPLKYELFSGGEVAANIDTPPTEPLVSLAQDALADVAGEERPLTGYVQTSDGRWFARDGIPIIIFGPSDPAVGHAADEFVSIEQLLEATRFYTLLALRWSGTQPA